MKVRTTFFEVALSGAMDSSWQSDLSCRTGEKEGIEYVHLKLHSIHPQTPPKLTLSWKVPGGNIYTRWSPFIGSRNLVPNWAGPMNAQLATGSPMCSLLDFEDNNRFTFAFSDALRLVRMHVGVREEDDDIECSLELFSVPEAPITDYSATLRLDSRTVYFGDAVRDVTSWYAEMPEYQPAPVPEAACQPIYSSWYTYHQNLFDHEIVEECARAKKYGMHGIILDDGWQTDDNSRGYAFCGDWEVAKTRFADFRSHVDAVHGLGMKYVVWFAVPFIGFRSKAYERFHDKILHSIDRLNAAVLDPRFPEIRRYLADIYVQALKEWNIDGFKLDFIDSFPLPKDAADPAVAENYRGRDIKSVPLAVDTLLSDVMHELRSIKPDILIEFRQGYIGPAIRKYGNMFRAADCPADPVSNRVRTVDLRLSSGNTAVHSDMLMWHSEETPEQAAFQLLSVLFSVPQISVHLSKIPESHRAMLHFWLDFCMENADILLKGDLHASRPDLNYPMVRASGERGSVTAVYDSMRVVEVPPVTDGKKHYVVNATPSKWILLSLASSASAEWVGTTGNPNTAGRQTLAPGLHRLPVPAAGLLTLS